MAKPCEQVLERKDDEKSQQKRNSINQGVDRNAKYAFDYRVRDFLSYLGLLSI